MRLSGLTTVLLAALVTFGGTAFAVDVEVTTGPVIAPDNTRHSNLDKCIAHVTAMLEADPSGANPLLCVRTTEVRAICPPADEPALPAEIDAIATQCPNDDNRWFNRTQGWKRAEYPSCVWELVMVPEEPQPAKFCTDPQVSMYDPSPDDAEPVPIDPDFDEHSPEGPGPGPPGAKPVDKVVNDPNVAAVEDTLDVAGDEPEPLVLF